MSDTYFDLLPSEIINLFFSKYIDFDYYDDYYKDLLNFY